MAVVLHSGLADNSERPKRRFGNWYVPCALLLASAMALSVDIAVANVFEHKQLPEFLHQQLVDALEICETFGHGTGVFLIVVAVCVIDRSNRRLFPWILAGAWGSGMMANVVKLLIHRTRPVHSGLQMKDVSVWDTFSRVANPDQPMQSFPSAHTATAFGLAMMLGTLYPHGRWLFFVFAVLVGMQRIAASAHFPSDVLAGASIGWIVGTVCAYSMMLSKARRETTIDQSATNTSSAPSQ